MPQPVEIITDEELRAWAGAFCDELDKGPAAALVEHWANAAATVPNADFREALRQVQRIIAIGTRMSWAVTLRPDVFSEPFRAALRYGELYSEVEVTLRRFADRPEEMFRPCGV